MQMENAMNGQEMQRRLELAYADWKRSLHFEEPTALQLSPPLLLSVPPVYTNAKRRILFCGQETYGWDWTSNQRTNRTMQDFLANPDAVEALCCGYRQFDFAKPHPKSWTSPFWRAFREVQDWPDAGLIWNNLSRCDYLGGSVLTARKEVQTCLSECQRELLLRELAILQPQVCLFVTGPNYDNLLSEVFPGCRLSEVANDIPVRQLARIQHSRLPASSFRTYHPNYLSRGRHWHFLARLRELVLIES